MLKLAVPLVALVALTGCPPPANYLDGSVKGAHDLTFDGEELRLLTDQKVFELQYTKHIDPNDPTRLDIVAKLDFNEPKDGAVKDKEINLLDAAIGGTCTRVTAAGDTFPETMKKAEVTFHSDAKVGTDVSGEFAVTFDNGETLFGNFDTKLTAESF